MRLAGKVAIISGAASGMGAATARMFAREGAKVVIADVLEDAGRQVASEIGDAERFENWMSPARTFGRRRRRRYRDSVRQGLCIRTSTTPRAAAPATPRHGRRTRSLVMATPRGRGHAAVSCPTGSDTTLRCTPDGSRIM